VPQIKTPSDIGALIRERRSRLGLNQQDLATKVGVRRLWISHLEQGKPTIQLGLVLRTLRELGINLSSFDSAEASRPLTNKPKTHNLRRHLPRDKSAQPKSAKPVKIDLNKVIQGTLSSKK
jgi:y4mF family transcriptional regulator